MRCSVALLKDVDKRIVERGEISFRNAVFKSANQAYWKVLISDENKKVRKDKLEFVKIKKIRLPPRSTVAPLSIIRHAFGTSIDVLSSELKKVEETREISHAIFYPIDDGEIEKGDIVGVIKVYPVNVGSVDDREYIKAPEIKPKLEKVKGKIVYREGKDIVRNEIEVKEAWYSRWNLGEWRMLIAEENVKLIPGNSRLIKVRNIEIPPNTIPVPLYGYRPPFGTVLDIYSPGRPRKIEERKIITHALFVPFEEGEIKEGDIIGVINVYNVAVGGIVESVTPFLTGSEKGNVIVREDGRLKRIQFEHRPFFFRRSALGYFKPIISTETIKIRANIPERVMVEKIDVPAGTIIQPMSGKAHASGVVIDVEFEEQKFVEDDRVIDYAIVISPVDGEILRGDMIGVIMQYQISPLTYPELFVKRYR